MFSWNKIRTYIARWKASNHCTTSALFRMDCPRALSKEKTIFNWLGWSTFSTSGHFSTLVEHGSSDEIWRLPQTVENVYDANSVILHQLVFETNVTASVWYLEFLELYFDFLIIHTTLAFNPLSKKDCQWLVHGTKIFIRIRAMLVLSSPLLDSKGFFQPFLRVLGL